MNATSLWSRLKFSQVVETILALLWIQSKRKVEEQQVISLALSCCQSCKLLSNHATTRDSTAGRTQNLLHLTALVRNYKTTRNNPGQYD